MFHSIRTCLTSAVSAVILVVASLCSDAADSPKSSPVIHLIDGDHLTGKLVHSPVDGTLGWLAPQFALPFQFQIDGISSIHFPVPATLPEAKGPYGLELVGGDLLVGTLLSLDDSTAVMDVAGFGKVTVDRKVVQRMFRRTGAGEQLFVGPTGLNGWNTQGEAGGWREEAGHLISDKAGSVLRRDFGLPSQVRIEFELSWTGNPDFDLAIGVNEDSKTVARAFRFEVWDNEIVVQRETEREADVMSLKKLSGMPDRLHLQAFLDQKLGRLMVFTSNGDQLADLSVSTSKNEILGGIQLTNRKGEIRLERLQIGRWVGEPPRKAHTDRSRIHQLDGSITYGLLRTYDPAAHEFSVDEDGTARTIPENQVNDIYISEIAKAEPRSIRLVTLSGMKFSGDVTRVDEQTLSLTEPGIQEPLTFQLADLQSLIVLKPKSELGELPQRRGRLEIDGTSLQGCLVDSRDDSAADVSCLVWQPLRCANASPLKKGLSGRIVYQEPTPPAVARQNQAQMMTGATRVVRTTPRRSSKKAGSVLHLRTGDMIPCEPISIDDKGLTFKSSITESTFVPNEQIKVLELISDAPPVEIAKLKKERLLTLPRMQRDNPPTHLLRSVDGDYLRGRLIGMDAEQIQVELRLEGKIVQRDRVARIIWLHPEGLIPAGKTPEADTTQLHLMQALLSDGNRLTFTPEKVTGSTLTGKSELLGVCPVDLTTTNQLLIGNAIEQATSELAFHQWKLKAATEPMAPQENADGGSGEGTEGLESALIGKPAPELVLKTLEGKSFRLDEHRGKVVILDFWASWCGPCLQVMPQIDQVHEEFADQGVELFAVNLEESPEKIKAALERLNLQPPVLLDRDGRAAERYGATAIPQTVIINRDGTVARLFVGGGSRFDTQLRTALKAVLSGASEKNESEKSEPTKEQ